MNKTHRENLNKLADYLAKLPKDYGNFNMRWYARSGRFGDGRLPCEATECGTVACAAGHGPAAGIGINENCYDWEKYINSNFGVSSNTLEWNFLFGPSWLSIDNTPHGAGARIKRYLEHGLPKEECFYKKESYESYLV